MNNGNLKALAGGSTPVIVQGLRDSQARSYCVPESLARAQGKIPTRNHGDMDDKNLNNIVKVRILKKSFHFEQE